MKCKTCQEQVLVHRCKSLVDDVRTWASITQALATLERSGKYQPISRCQILGKFSSRRPVFEFHTHLFCSHSWRRTSVEQRQTEVNAFTSNYLERLMCNVNLHSPVNKTHSHTRSESFVIENSLFLLCVSPLISIRFSSYFLLLPLYRFIYFWVAYSLTTFYCNHPHHGIFASSLCCSFS